jgi:hypothetical protein
MFPSRRSRALPRATASAPSLASVADHVRQGTFVRQGQRDRAAAGTEIGDPRWTPGRQALQGQFDQQFGFRPRHQRVRRDRQVECPESAPASDIGHRFALFATLQLFFETIRSARVDRVVAVREQPASRFAEHNASSSFGIGALDADTCGCEQGIDA